MKQISNIRLWALFFISLPLFADNTSPKVLPLSEILEQPLIEQLLTQGEVSRFHEDDFSLELLPETKSAGVIRQTVKDGELNLGTEALYLNTNFDISLFSESPESHLLEYYNILNGVSTLEGLEYYSASRKKMRLLFEESWRIDKLENPDKSLTDLSFDMIPASNQFYIHQKDKTFGKSESRMEVTFSFPVIYTSLTNMTPLYYTIVKVIEPEEMQIHMMIIPTDQGLLFYGIMGADTYSISVFRNKARNSFYNRIKALNRWFSEEAGL